MRGVSGVQSGHTPPTIKRTAEEHNNTAGTDFDVTFSDINEPLTGVHPTPRVAATRSLHGGKAARELAGELRRLAANELR